MRRTMHVDVGARTDWSVPLPITGAARDLRTGADGAPQVLDAARVEAAFDRERRLVEVTSSPSVSWLADLVGTRAGGGFRRRLGEVVPATEGVSLVRQVLDDMPAGVLISGYGFMRLARRQGFAPSSLTPPNVLEHMVDLCSGWRAGGVAAASIGQGHGVPMQDCPPAPELRGEPLAPALHAGTPDRTASVGPAADPWAWHEIEPLAADHMRRRRCLDLSVGADGRFTLWAMFRDTVGEPGGGESVLHEYAVRGGGEDGVLTELEADARVLPFPECPGAAAHVSALAGAKVADLPTAVPERLTGVSSCTHLNDLLRALGGLASLFDVAA